MASSVPAGAAEVMMHSFDTFTQPFQGRPLTTLVWEGRLAWVASHVGAVLGYPGHGRRLVHHVLGDWNAQLAEGHDYLFLSGDALTALRSISAEEPVVASPHARDSLLLLFEPGLQLVLARSEPAAAEDLQRFLDDEVLPRMIREASVSVDLSSPGEGSRSWTLPLPTPLSLVVQPTQAERREERALLQAKTQAAWADLYDRRFRARALQHLIDALGSTLHDAAKVALVLTAAEIATGIDLSSLLDDPDDGGDDPSDGQVLELDRAA